MENLLKMFDHVDGSCQAFLPHREHHLFGSGPSSAIERDHCPSMKSCLSRNW